MKGKAVIPLILGLCIGLFAVRFGINAINSARAAGANRETVTAVMAVTDINASQQITEEMVQLIETAPNQLLPAEQRITDLKQVVGRVAQKAVPEGSAVLLSMLAPEGTSPGMVGRIPEGFRAFTIKADETTTVAYQVKPGDWVDLMLVMDVQGRGRSKETIAEVFLQHVQVAAVGRHLSAPSTEEPGKGQNVRSVTLLVPETETTRLHLAQIKGRLTLALRGDDPIIHEGTLAAKSSDLLKSIKDEEKPTLPAKVVEEVPPQPDLSQAASLMAQGEPELPPYGLMIYRGGSSDKPEGLVFDGATPRKIVRVCGGPAELHAHLRGARDAETQKAGLAVQSSSLMKRENQTIQEPGPRPQANPDLPDEPELIKEVSQDEPGE